MTRRSSLLLAVALAGCGGSSDQMSTAPVTGTVTFENAPVTGGSLTFRPAGIGKPATAKIQEDGTFTLSTYESGDGAVVAAHTVRYAPPAVAATGGHDAEGAAKPATGKYHGLVPKESKVVIGPNPNVIAIELIKQ